MEPAHIFIVQISSLLALLASFAALFLVGKSLTRLLSGTTKNALIALFLQIFVISISLCAMFVYHFFDIDVAQDIWHFGALISLFMGVVAAVYLIKLHKIFHAHI